MKNSVPKVNFKAKQAEFSAYIRNPEQSPCPDDVQIERMQMYRSLFFNNVESFLSSNFPVLRRLLNDQQWHALAQDFFSQHRCHSPYFTEIPEAFIDYLQSERNTQSTDYPFLLELAHYEWVEMALSIAQETLSIDTHQSIENLSQTLSLSPLAWPLAYQYPVHKISPDFLPNLPSEQPSYFVIHRDANHDVHFIELSAMNFMLLQTLQTEDTLKINELLNILLPKNYSDTLQQMALDAIQQFINKQIIML